MKRVEAGAADFIAFSRRLHTPFINPAEDRGMARVPGDLQPFAQWDRRFLASVTAHATGLAVFTGCQALALLWPSLKMQLFCGPSAMLASLFLGTPIVGSVDAFLLPHGTLDIRVLESCSGFDFFALLSAILSAMAVGRAKRPVMRLVLLVPVCWAIALLANSVRIISAVQVHLLADVLPRSLSPSAAHTIVGVSVFILFLAVSCQLARSAYAKP